MRRSVLLVLLLVVLVVLCWLVVLKGARLIHPKPSVENKEWPPSSAHLSSGAMTACSSSSCLSCLPGRPLAETCVVCGRTPPRFFFFVISGSACNGIQLAIDRLLVRAARLQPRPAPALDRLLALARAQALALPEGRWWVPTLCWTLSYAMSISFRFVSHAAVVFGPHRDPPLLALGKTYLTYMSTIVASTAINLALVAGGGARGKCKRTVASPVPGALRARAAAHGAGTLALGARRGLSKRGLLPRLPHPTS